MAQIHKAHNELEEKIINLRRSRHTYWNDVRSKDIKRSAIMMIAGLIVCVIVYIFPNLATGLRDLLADFSAGIEHPLLQLEYPNIFFFQKFLNGSTLPDIIGFLLDSLISLILLIVIALVDLSALILTFALPYVVWGGMYLLPACAVLFGVKGLFTALTSSVYGSLAGTPSEEEEILQVGLDGEQKALREMEALSDDCHVYTNLMIPHDGKISETDMIAVTDTGITIIEVKNHKGTITGSAHDENLGQHKLHGNNETETKTFYNPIKQVATHAYRLKEFLHTNGVHTHVRTCVFFVNDEAFLQLYDISSNCPVFDVRTVQDLRTYLTSGSTTFPEHAKQKAILLLNDLTAKSYHTIS